jgi:hypothetical protein
MKWKIPIFADSENLQYLRTLKICNICGLWKFAIFADSENLRMHNQFKIFGKKWKKKNKLFELCGGQFWLLQAIDPSIRPSVHEEII